MNIARSSLGYWKKMTNFQKAGWAYVGANFLQILDGISNNDTFRQQVGLSGLIPSAFMFMDPNNCWIKPSKHSALVNALRDGEKWVRQNSAFAAGMGIQAKAFLNIYSGLNDPTGSSWDIASGAALGLLGIALAATNDLRSLSSVFNRLPDSFHAYHEKVVNPAIFKCLSVFEMAYSAFNFATGLPIMAGKAGLMSSGAGILYFYAGLKIRNAKSPRPNPEAGERKTLLGVLGNIGLSAHQDLKILAYNTYYR